MNLDRKEPGPHARRIRNRDAVTEDPSRYRRLVQCIDGIAWEADPKDFSFLFLGPQVESILGYPPDEWLGRPDAFFSLLPDADRHAVLALLEKVVEHRTSERFEFRIRHRNGQMRWIKSVASSAGDHGEQSVLIGVMMDVTERKENEREVQERHEYQQELNHVLVHLNRSQNLFRGDLKHRIRQLTEKAAGALDVARVNAWRFTPEDKHLECLDHFEKKTGTHRRLDPVPLALYPRYLQALRHSRMVHVDDVGTDPRTRELQEPYLGPAHIRSLLDAPIRFQGQLAGVVCFEHTGTIRHWTVEEQQFAASIADMAALGMEASERARAEASLRQAHEELEERVATRTEELRSLVNAMAGREVRMEELKHTIRALRRQLREAHLVPCADDPLCPEREP